MLKLITKLSLTVGVVALAMVWIQACGGGTCLSRCNEAQSRSCTSIKDCNKFCSASANLASKANCQTQYDNAVSCGNKHDACAYDANCGGETNAFGACVGSYCLANGGDADCQAMLNP